MTYQDALTALNRLAPELYTAPGQSRRKFSLDEFRILLAALGNPEQATPAVLIAGTNGKGSTASTLASILTAAGVRTGLYTSPHLVEPNERIRVDGELIANHKFAEHFARVRSIGEQLLAAGQLPQTPSFFETLTAMAFLHFRDQQAQCAVLEVGLGGRLDATNVVEPILSIITDIDLDHQAWLGNTIAAITREKAGILRAGGAMVTLPQIPEANRTLGEVAMELGVRGISAAPYMPAIGTAAGTPYLVEAIGDSVRVASPLLGAHQHRNVALAIAAAVELVESKRYTITPQAIEQGIAQTVWPGRLELVQTGNGKWLLDVAHNPAGAWALRAGLRESFAVAPRILVFGCLNDKPAEALAQILFPLFDEIIFAPIDSPRATPTDQLLAIAAQLGNKAQAADSVHSALAKARELAGSEMVVVSGSVYLVGAVHSLFRGGVL